MKGSDGWPGIIIDKNFLVNKSSIIFALRIAARRRREQAVILISALGPVAISRSRRNLAFS
jgi:hypothetical protein